MRHLRNQLFLSVYKTSLIQRQIIDQTTTCRTKCTLGEEVVAFILVNVILEKIATENCDFYKIGVCLILCQNGRMRIGEKNMTLKVIFTGLF